MPGRAPPWDQDIWPMWAYRAVSSGTNTNANANTNIACQRKMRKQASTVPTYEWDAVGIVTGIPREANGGRVPYT